MSCGRDGSKPPAGSNQSKGPTKGAGFAGASSPAGTLGSRVEAGIRDPRDSMPYSTLRTCGVHNFEYCWVRFNERRHFTACVYEQHIDGRLKELTLHALCQHLAMPMILLAGRWRILRDHERPISVDRGENDRHHEAAVEKQEQDFPYLLRSLLNIPIIEKTPDHCDAS